MGDTMQKTKLPYYEMIALAIGEVIVSAIVAIVFLCINMFTYAVILGAILGSALIIINFYALSISTTNALNRAIAEVGGEAMEEEAAKEFAARHQAKIQTIMTVSFIARMLSLAAALVVAFILKDIFNPLATAIPLLMFRPILMVAGLISKRRCS